MPTLQLDGPAILAIRDKAYAQHKRRFANHVLQILGTVLNWGRPRKLSSGNPLGGQRGIKIARPRDLPRANRPWSDEETDAVPGAARGGLKLAIALACYAGMRGGDTVRVTWSIYDGQTLEWKQGKTGDPVWLPALTELRACSTQRRKSPRLSRPTPMVGRDRSGAAQGVPHTDPAARESGSDRSRPYTKSLGARLT